MVLASISPDLILVKFGHDLDLHCVSELKIKITLNFQGQIWNNSNKHNFISMVPKKSACRGVNNNSVIHVIYGLSQMLVHRLYSPYPSHGWILTHLMLEMDYSGLFGEYHACWCPGDLVTRASTDMVLIV